MESFVLSELRRAMGLSLADMARLIGLDGLNASDRVREMERGARPISGPLLCVLNYLAQAVGTNDSAAISLSRFLPRWLDCSDLEKNTGTADIIMHTRWPRFLGWITDDLSHDQNLTELLSAAKIPVVPMNPGLGLGNLVVLFIDQPAGETKALISEAVRLKEMQVRRSAGLQENKTMRAL